MPDRIIHIGFPKTGTTFLQRNVYPYLSGVEYYDYKVSDSLFYETIFLDELDYDPENNREIFTDYFRQDRTLFSFESLAGAPFIYNGANRSQIPSRLKDIGFNKVIITIRNQVSILDSLYRQYVVQGGVMSFKDFIDLENKWKLSIKPFYLGYLDYDKLVALYHRVFGKENVLVLLQEDLKDDSKAFEKKVIDFVGANGIEYPVKIKIKNESLTNLSVRMLRICNHFIFTSQKPNNLISNKISTWLVRRIFAVILDPFLLRFLSSKKSHLKNNQKEFVNNRYQESNQKLERLIGTSLPKNYFK